MSETTKEARESSYSFRQPWAAATALIVLMVGGAAIAQGATREKFDAGLFTFGLLLTAGACLLGYELLFRRVKTLRLLGTTLTWETVARHGTLELTEIERIERPRWKETSIRLRLPDGRSVSLYATQEFLYFVEDMNHACPALAAIWPVFSPRSLRSAAPYAIYEARTVVVGGTSDSSR